jgi:predicted nucleic acid-binding protein
VGSLILPPTGAVYVDTQILIYTVQRHPDYLPLLRPLWATMQTGALKVLTSELTLMEVLVVPLRHANQSLVADYEAFLALPGISLQPVDRTTLYEAARLRANAPRLKTPDAIHIATSNLARCQLYLTNDRALAKVSTISTVILDDLIP